MEWDISRCVVHKSVDYPTRTDAGAAQRDIRKRKVTNRFSHWFCPVNKIRTLRSYSEPSLMNLLDRRTDLNDVRPGEGFGDHRLLLLFCAAAPALVSPNQEKLDELLCVVVLLVGTAGTGV